jgi:amino acid transporter
VVAPDVPGWVWVIVFVVAVAAINLRGIVVTARMNMAFLVIQLVAFVIFIGGALLAITQGRASFSLTPIFQPEHFTLALLFSAIPLAAFAYIGFDAISTLNEEARGGGRAVSKATMIVLFSVIVLFVVQVYFAALFVPTTDPFPVGDATNNAFYDIACSPTFSYLTRRVPSWSSRWRATASCLASSRGSARIDACRR